MLSIDIQDAGYGYTEAEAFIEGDGTGAFASVNLDTATGKITSLEVLNQEVDTLTRKS